MPCPKTPGKKITKTVITNESSIIVIYISQIVAVATPISPRGSWKRGIYTNVRGL